MSVQSCVIPTGEYRDFLRRLAQSVGTDWPDDLRAWHSVYCDTCGAEWTGEALDLLLAMGPGSSFGGERVAMINPTAAGDSIRSGNCPFCGHGIIRVVVKDAEQKERYDLLVQRGVQLHCDVCKRDYPASTCRDVSVKESGTVIFTCPTCRVPRVQFRLLKM